MLATYRYDHTKVPQSLENYHRPLVGMSALVSHGRHSEAYALGLRALQAAVMHLPLACVCAGKGCKGTDIHGSDN